MIQNAFTSIRNCDIHRAISFDSLHTDQSGIWGEYLEGDLRLKIEICPRDIAAKLDEQYVPLR